MTTLLMIGGTEIALSVDLSLAVENILFVLGLIIVFKLAPRRTEKYPVSNEEDHYLKKKSVLTVCIFWGLVCHHSSGYFWKNDDNSYVYRDVDIAAKISMHRYEEPA